MRDAIIRVFPQVEELFSDDRRKRWRIPGNVISNLVSFTADELADLEAAILLLKRENMNDPANNLQDLSTKLRAIMDGNVARRVEPDLEALLQAEGLAMRPGPRPRINSMALEELRGAIKACEKVRIRHRNRVTNRLRSRTVQPYGFLHGSRHYLVAFDEKAADIRKFTLPNVEEVHATGEYFDRDPEFSLEIYAEASFGVYNEAPADVVWRFKKEVAPDVKQYLFHPSQRMFEEADGSIKVSFRAGGRLEMAWHLYQWGDNVEVIEPASLKNMVHKNRTSWPGNP